VSNIPCRWKIWLIDDARHEAGIRFNPALGEFSIKQFDVLEAPTRVTRGPIAAAISA
jgi:hypothetical protein